MGLFNWKGSGRQPDPKPTDADLAKAFFDMGNTCTGQRRYDEAAQWYQKSLVIRERIAADSDALSDLRALSECYGMLGNIALAQGRGEEADPWYRKSLVIDERIAAESGTPESYDDLAVTYSNLGVRLRSVEMMEKALGIWRDLVRQCPDVALYRRRAAETEENIEKLKEYLSRQS